MLRVGEHFPEIRVFSTEETRVSSELASCFYVPGTRIYTASTSCVCARSCYLGCLSLCTKERRDTLKHLFTTLNVTATRLQRRLCTRSRQVLYRIGAIEIFEEPAESFAAPTTDLALSVVMSSSSLSHIIGVARRRLSHSCSESNSEMAGRRRLREWSGRAPPPLFSPMPHLRHEEREF